jgi:hypothetical protein
MSVKLLPPNLQTLHSQLSIDTPDRNPWMREELEAIGELIARNRSTDPSSAELRKIDLLNKSYTGTTGSGQGKGICQCCKRPY